ncbi:MAG: hypothetical protein ABJM06_10020 [Gilvibacter sp.]
MNKSRINKILIVALTLIWSFVGYSFFWPKSIAETPLQNTEMALETTVKTKAKDQFVLQPLDRDPFLNARTKPRKKIESIPKDRPKSSPKNTKTIWPNIAYFGFVKSNNQSAPLVLLKIDNRLKRLRQGERFEEILIKKVYRDSIQIQFGNESKVYAKN